jgi:hypothetical protein
MLLLVLLTVVGFCWLGQGCCVRPLHMSSGAKFRILIRVTFAVAAPFLYSSPEPGSEGSHEHAVGNCATGGHRALRKRASII